MEKNEETSHKSLPTEILEAMVVDSAKNSINIANLMLTDKSFNEAINRISWKTVYHRLYNKSDELDAEKPSHESKFFLRYFLPSGSKSNNNDWLKAVINRSKYDFLLYEACVGKTASERSGWKSEPFNRLKNFKYHEQINDGTYRYGFSYEWTPAFMQTIAQLEMKLHLCFLELTAEKFLSDPTEYPVSAVDPYHFIKRVNFHIMYAKHLCSKTIPDPPALVADANPDPRQYNNYNGPEEIILDGDNVEYTIQPGRKCGFYTNYACQGLFWGNQLDELMRHKYKVDVSLYDEQIFHPVPAYKNFSNLTQ